MNGVNVISHDDGVNIVRAIKRMTDVIGKGQQKAGTIYGFNVSGSVADPASKITYLRDAVGMTKAYMDFSSRVFNYGSWRDAFFQPRPCMLGYDGRVLYYLDPNDYSKKSDGAPSDIANDSFEGNAMMEFPKIYWKVEPTEDGKGANVFIADYAPDDGFHCWCNIDKDGNEKEHFYMAIYQGCTINGKMRSVSGKAYTNYTRNTTAQAEINLASANGNGWYISQYADILLVDYLSMLMFKSTNIQNVLGRGNANSSYDESYTLTTGSLDNKGLFWGTNNGAWDSADAGVKLFGIENYYGNKLKRLAGIINDNGNIKYKLTRGTSDGSTATDYNLDGSGYISSDITPAGTSGGYINEMKFSADGSMLPKTASGSDSTHYCDGMSFNNAQNNFALFGGGLDGKSQVGCYYLDLGAGAGRMYWSIGASLSYK